ncbi:uncharacterized protein [Ptychodera flava]|uniref:uncharacterized protein isoform X1 n=1 Tax=Ptychodera flava TaxID=63121 RepID=UPI00396AA72B
MLLCIICLHIQGGMKAVIWTDVFQFLVIVGTLMTVIILGTIEAGGLQYVWEANKQDGRLDVFKVPFDLTQRTTIFSAIFGGGMNTIPQFISQTAVQRYMSSKTLKHAQMSVLLNMPFQLIILPTVYFSGLVMYAYYNNDIMPLQPPINATNASIVIVGGQHYSPDYTSSDQLSVVWIKLHDRRDFRRHDETLATMKGGKNTQKRVRKRRPGHNFHQNSDCYLRNHCNWPCLRGILFRIASFLGKYYIWHFWRTSGRRFYLGNVLQKGQFMGGHFLVCCSVLVSVCGLVLVPLYIQTFWKKLYPSTRSPRSASDHAALISIAPVN